MKLSGKLFMKILAIEFSSAQRSIAVWNGSGASETAIGEAIETDPRKTNALGMVEEALRKAGLEREQIECLAVGIGPGSYTGMRAAIALAQGWQLAREVKLLGISSAEAIAAQAQSNGLSGSVTVVIDAQREEFYVARYELSQGACREMSPLAILPLLELREREAAGEVLIGPEIQRWLPRAQTVFPSASALARLAARRTNFVSGEKLEPIYLRETTFVKAPPSRVIS